LKAHGTACLPGEFPGFENKLPIADGEAVLNMHAGPFLLEESEVARAETQAKRPLHGKLRNSTVDQVDVARVTSVASLG
jgi:hypothetical protein